MALINIEEVEIEISLFRDNYVSIPDAKASALNEIIDQLWLRGTDVTTLSIMYDVIWVPVPKTRIDRYKVKFIGLREDLFLIKQTISTIVN